MSDTTRMAAKPEECSTRLAKIRARDAKFELPMHPEYNTAAEHDRRWLLVRLDALATATRGLLLSFDVNHLDGQSMDGESGTRLYRALAALAETEGA